MTVALVRSRQRTFGSYRPLTPLRSESFRRKGCEARGGVPTSVVGPFRSGTWSLTIEPTVWSSARSSKGRPTGSQRPHRPKARRTRPTTSSGRTKTSFVLPRRRERAEDAKPKSSNRPKNCWFMVGAGRREEGSRAESDKVQTSRYPTVAAPERRPAGTRSRVNAGNGSSRRRRRGDGMTTPRVLSTAAPNLRSTAWRHKKVTSLPDAIGFGAAGPASHLLLGRNSRDLGSPAQ